jgi:anthranilate phosphoribosyltransferase
MKHVLNHRVRARALQPVVMRLIQPDARHPRRDIVLVNASAGLVAAGKAQTFRDAMTLAAASIDSGAAQNKVQALARFTSI